ncbi:uncharacterized protein LOC111869224 [Cryptotermes secundus]|uniref:uncharacterized protein LOC111869224 n=1 Tax=Cryptotermes secundus TaxID=105785 RepID=UPI000CD7D904|nr:uncharacterized protein LOC111869224 [Cryptotermes secundus]
MAIGVLFLLASCLTAKSAATEYYPANCSVSPPVTIRGQSTPEPPTVDMLLGRWIVVKQDKNNEPMNCPTVDLVKTENDSMIEATLSTVNTSSKDKISQTTNVTLYVNNTVFRLENGEEEFFLNTLDQEVNYAIIFTCHGNKAVRYVATKENSSRVVVEGDDLQDVKQDCSSAFTFIQQSMITMMLTVFPLTFLL